MLGHTLMKSSCGFFLFPFPESLRASCASESRLAKMRLKRVNLLLVPAVTGKSSGKEMPLFFFAS